MMPIIAFIAAQGSTAELSAGNGGTVSIVDGIAPYSSTVGIRFLTDGTVEIYEDNNAIVADWESHGSWISDTGFITGDEEVRFTNFNGSGGGDWTSEAAADDVWIGITQTRTWLFGTIAAGTYSFTCDFEVRDAVNNLTTGSVSYTFQIQNIV